MRTTLEEHAQGRFDADITLVHYGDYECPHTRRSLLTVQVLKRELADRLLYVFRHFPLEQIHPHARSAAAAAEAAAGQGEFWRMHELLFEHPTALDVRDLRHYAVVVGLDPDRFERDMNSPETSAHIEQLVAGGRRSGVRQTPAFLVNGRLHQGPYHVESVRTSIAEALDRLPLDRA
jgi:protein-disulfide isomerase